ncbi:helix-turn-helix domain-containing protein [Mucilaginibacter sp. PAMB04168]|uniref:helix-turn-helix domain-containing protein n=1 Tax=Mucilaginibacter sp. PAMB04168 TaxID=3138567 RepID=UPI0031F6786F
MNLHQKIALARHQMGLTQEELANQANVTARTIQRIESGESIPRKFTLKLIAAALHIPFDELNSMGEEIVVAPEPGAVSNQTEVSEDLWVKMASNEDKVNFLRLLCLSCFSYLLVPYVHFLIPSYLLKRRHEQDPAVLRFARNVIQNQVYWVIATVAAFLLTLGYNFMQAAYLKNQYPANYLLVFFLMYFINPFLILKSFTQINKRFLGE